MSEETNCSRCKHRLPKNICGSPESPYHNQKISQTGRCDFFSENPAQDYFTRGLKYILADNRHDGVRELETAIELGLPHDDEMMARFALGESYASIVNWDLPSEEMIATHEFSVSISQMEKAVLMDAEGNYTYFSEPLNRARLESLDISYTLIGNSIRKKDGDDAAIAYSQKLELFDYLESSPMLRMLLNLGVIYAERDEKERAGECFKRIIQAEPLDPVDEKGTEAKTRSMAHDNLKLLESEDDDKKSKCFIATAAYGTPYAPQVQSLRRFRDKFLLPKSSGRLFVRVYNRFSPFFASTIAKSKSAQKFTKMVILKPILWLIVGNRYLLYKRNKER